jgi:carbamoyltransferase
MIVKGISEGFHDASVALVEGDKILWAKHAERLTRKKNDRTNPGFLRNVDADISVFYENVPLKNERRIAYSQVPVSTKIFEQCDYHTYHHESHAAGAYYTAPFDEDIVVVVIDAIGEWTCSSFWIMENRKLKKVYEKIYPQSIGLFYSAITKRIGLKPNEDEYITMGMAAYGKPCVDMQYCFNEWANWHKGFSLDDFKGYSAADIAASAQLQTEHEIGKIMGFASNWGKNLCYAGGVALNCVANSKILPEYFDKIWIYPNPGDAGSSLGAALAYTGKRVEYSPYLGTDIQRHVNPRIVATELLKQKVVGVANGKAEFGPRALGNRSLLGDVRYSIKSTVNKIKKRQQFRPFAPAILSEFADEYFEGPMNEYMQFTAQAKHDYDSVTHVDNSARVQLVTPDSTSILRPILEEYYERTKVPMLLNTSLNIKGQPMVDNRFDAVEFEKKYGVQVF